MKQERTQSLRLPPKSGKLIPRDLSESLGKMPPQALDMEENVLGALILEGQSIKQVPFLKPEHFYSEQHKEIFVIIQKIGGGGDISRVRAELKKAGKLELIGGHLYLIELTNKLSSAANIEYHARYVMEMALKRELIQIASEIHHKAYEDTQDVFELIKKVEDDVAGITEFKDDMAARSYIEPDVEYVINDLKTEATQAYTKCHVIQLEPIFKHTKGTVAGWYGWPGDGKGTMYEFLSVRKAMEDNWVYCMAKPEDLNSKLVNGRGVISADNIYLRLAWIFLGKPTMKDAAKRLGVPAATETELRQALKWVKEHFIIVNVNGPNINLVIDAFAYHFKRMKEKIDVFNIDPWTAYEMEERSRGDYTLRHTLSRCKTTALLTNTRWDIITHPRTISDPREKKGGAFKLVDQYLINGGATWDNACDQQYSIRQPERHLKDKPEKLIDFHTLKQKAEEVAGCTNGVYEGIRFDKRTRRFLFNNYDPISGNKIPYVQYGDAQTTIVMPEENLPF